MNLYPVCCPESLFDAANHFAMVIGQSAADGLTWRTPVFEKNGTNYATYNLMLPAHIITQASHPLTRPDWDIDEIIDMNLAKECQSQIDFVEVDFEKPFPQIQPTRILVLLNYNDINEAVKHWGLQLIQDNEE
jgi:hypothetical protein